MKLTMLAARISFPDDTVEAKVYKALEGRISWFETVVGTLQPILARVARAIQEAAMTGRDARPQRLSAALEELKRQLNEQQVDALDLDSWLGLDEERTFNVSLAPCNTARYRENAFRGADSAATF